MIRKVVSIFSGAVAASSASSSCRSVSTPSASVASLTAKRIWSLTWTALANGQRFRPITALVSLSRGSATTLA
ncbi:hypothetical protein G6F22_022043 [Rhizopus arrhizus]|nr:hypothetical protein G6F22_022043 [Rhizopus arrhizus]